ncbi:uncharacterized protein BDZ99DRAFT_528505 [Mytilinidion resinicola]|uniref:HAUS augmin-like complex subunit 6 N-terminal domain-containing protein n=1 Tax=Mytilinidion resinicola TaxID=574789 RepID=A0A6A6XZJ3_9PEZI|nr:uncharacterized protein BDZ99DRAFT_528505 [Mytilinidion resinicola]KAF2801395.1 hypothetical protein BDZ99DRAFT_528505 [Mytilinidion resinicola]
MSVKASSGPAKSSNTALFLTNLRLLDLDLRDDWPAITAQTFTTQNAQQNQKNRIRCVEWALFRLFELWDAEETREKLHPFFPPLEPLQSLNLRAAMYRSLNELKKNGVLGRTSVLRKTMLDECKDEKLMELLLVFSTAVLKKRIASTRKRGPKKDTVAKTLATAPLLNVSEQSSLLPLAIAHKASLQAALAKKEVQRKRYVEFSELLDTKADDINQRIENCREEKHSGRNFSKNVDTASVKRQLRENWSGDAKWIDAMLYGDDEKSDDVFLQKPFKDIWPRVEKGGTLQGQGMHEGLLESLEARVKQQQSRISRWQEFHDQIKSHPSSAKDTKSPPRKENAAPICAFDAHVELQIGKFRDEVAANSTRASQTYQDIISEMNDELSKESKLRRDRAAISHSRRGSRSRSPIKRTKSRSNSIPKKPLEVAIEVKPAAKPAPKPPPKKQPFDKVPVLARKYEPSSTPIGSDATLIGSAIETLPSLPALQPQPILPPRNNESEEVPRKFTRPTSPPPPPRSPTPPPPELPISKEDLLAEQIISSIGDATPSPVKKPRPSLTERARMSMAHASAFQLPETIEESPPSLPPLPTIPQETILNRRATLAERTRQSMARVSLAPQHKSRKSMSTKRQSVFPVNQFETPRKSMAIEEEPRGDSTPKEYLFSEKAEYENVFKSRPKIAVSPILSPENAGEDGDEEDELPMDSILEMDMDDSGPVDNWESSPLRRPAIMERGRV